jgi:hypothetical protein
MFWISTLTQRRYNQAERSIFFEDETLAYAALGISLRAAIESINLERPLNIRLMPTSVPITQTELEGHCLQIKIPRIRVMIPSNSTHPEFGTSRIPK